jgi:glutamine synthetase
VNSYKRLVEGYWAPTRVTWGRDNRTVCMRVIPGSDKSTRLELRVGGADINPYLAVAAALAAGLYGIENDLPLKAPMVEGSGYDAREAVRLPRNLDEATEKFHGSKIARELFGDKFVEHFAATRRWEWRESQKAVTDWELKRYFETI